MWTFWVGDVGKLGEVYTKGDRWGISAKIEGKENDEAKIVYYKWEKEDLVKIFSNKHLGRKIMNALYSIWLP